MERTPLADAAGDLAQAAFELIGQLTANPDLANAEPVFTAVRRFYVVYHSSVGDGRSDDVGELLAGTPGDPRSTSPPRFQSAIMVIEPGVFDPAAIARFILTACEEVVEEGGFPALDPAVRLMAAKLSWLCSVTANLRDAGGLMFACTRRTFEG
jgi:hypothetical protein